MGSSIRFRQKWVNGVCLTIGIGAVISTVLLWLLPPRSQPTNSENLIIGPLSNTASQAPHTWIQVNRGVIDRVSHDGDWISKATRGGVHLGEGLYAVPGLVDSHVHLPPTLLPGQLDFLLLMFLAHGVTSVRELGSPYLNVADLQSSIREGERAGPRIFGCGVPLTGTNQGIPFLESVRNDGELDHAIDKRARAGLRCVKIYRGFPGSLLPRAAEAARRTGMLLVGHLPLDSTWDSTDMGDIQHVCDPRCASMRPDGMKSLALATRDGAVRHTPTLVTFENPLNQMRATQSSTKNLVPEFWTHSFWNPNTLAAMGIRGFLDIRAMRTESTLAQTATQELIRAGATLQVGTDTPFPFVIPGASVHEEMRLLEELGYPIEKVWNAATSTPGSLLSGGTLGRLVPGAPADILLFREDPTRDLRALSTLEYVIAAGRVYDVDDLRARVARQLRYLDGPIYRYGIDPAVQKAIRYFARDPVFLQRTSP